MFKLEQRNEVITGSLAGTIAAIVKYAFNELMQILNIAKYDNNATSLGMVMKGWETTPAFTFFGFIVALIIGAFFGVVIAFAFRYLLNRDYPLFKGAMIGVAIWLLNFGVMTNLFNYPADLATSLGDIVAMLLSLIIFGIVCVYSLEKLNFFHEV